MSVPVPGNFFLPLPLTDQNIYKSITARKWSSVICDNSSFQTDKLHSKTTYNKLLFLVLANNICQHLLNFFSSKSKHLKTNPRAFQKQTPPPLPLPLPKMPNQETSVDQYRNGTGSAATATTATTTTTSHRKASFIDNLTPNVQSVSRKNSAHSATAPKPVKEEVLYSSKSLKLSEYTFSDCHGNQKSAEVIHKHFDPNCLPQTYGTETTTLTAKNTSLPSALADSAYDHPDQGILSIAILKRHILCDCLILVKKYRPTLKSFVLEFPAKIVEHNNLASGPQSSAASTDGNESDTSVGDAAVKDVEENTGYKSTQVKWVSPDTAVDPGKWPRF